MKRYAPGALLLTTALLVSLLAWSGAAIAGPRDHEDGFFLRLSMGGGTASTALDDGTDRLEMSGSAADLNFAVGAIVSPNFALHGTLLGWSASDPDLEFNGTTVGEINGDVTATAFGAGLTYFFMPVNMYLSGSLCFGGLELDLGNFSGETDDGLMADVTLGKEWWVGDKWGLGAALGFTWHDFSDSSVDENWTGNSFCLRFTATMN